MAHSRPIVTSLHVPLASVQGTLALDLSPRHAPPPVPPATGLGADADVVPIDPEQRDQLEQWVHRDRKSTRLNSSH